MLGIRTADSKAPKQVGLILAVVYVGRGVENLAYIHAKAKKFFASGLEVRNDQVHAFAGAGCCRGNVFAEDDRATGAGRRKLDHAVAFTGIVVRIEPPSQPRVKFLRAVHIGNGNDGNLELHVDWRGFRFAGSITAADWLGAHGCLLGGVISWSPLGWKG